MNDLDREDATRTLLRLSFAQNMEDILIDRVFHGRKGTYMDIGANHPILESNTQFFYLRGWRGVNLEPIPTNHALFEQHRAEDTNLAVAASDFGGTMPFFEIANEGGLTGHSTLAADVADHHRGPGFRVAEYQVPVRTVSSLIDEYRIEPPDFVSIDVEGHEARVIRGIPLERWRPKMLVVESLVPLEHVASHISWEPRLLENGYIFAAFNGINRFYLHSDLSDKLPLLQTPVNVLDHYKTHDTYELEVRIQQLDRLANEARSALDLERARIAELQAGWEFGLNQAQHAQAAWERECAEFNRQRAQWSETVASFERSHAEWSRDRENLIREWKREVDHYQRLLAATQTELRPYRLIDRFRVLNAGYGWVRSIKHRRAS